MSNNPTRDQIAYAYQKYSEARDGDSVLAMADLATFLRGYSAPPPPDPLHPEMVLDAPAKVGETIFSAGQPWFAVVSRAMTEFAESGGPKPTDAQIEEFRQLVEAMLPRPSEPGS